MKKQTETFEKTALSIAVALCLFVPIMAFSQLANASKDDEGGAGGDKVNSWQNNTSELPTAYLPLSLNLDTCEPVSENEISTTYSCDSFVFGTFTVVDPK